MPIALPTRVWAIAGIGLLARLFAGAASTSAFDYTQHRLPTAACLEQGGLLYCDCVCNHTPLYPYLSALMLRLSPDVSFVRAAFLMLPAALGDALIPIVLFVLLRKLEKEKLGFPAAAIYALNPISIYEVRLAHWDGLTTCAVLLGLYALIAGAGARSGAIAGVGALLKQFPLALVPIAAFSRRKPKTLLLMAGTAAGVTALGLLPFLLECPETLVRSLASHPLWNGSAPQGVGVGTVQQVFAELGVPQAKLVWAFGFSLLLIAGTLRANPSNVFYFTGLVMVVLAYFTYATHRQLVVWALPFMIVVALEMKAPWPLVLVGAGYAIRLLKPAWYLGFVHLL